MADSITQWWGERPRWQKVAIGAGVAAVAVASGGAVAYAIALHGASVTVVTTGGTTVTAAVGRAAVEAAKRLRA